MQTLLQSLDDHHNGMLDAAELGRLVRLSPQRRSAIDDTIAKCANIIKRQPSEIKACVDIIEMCTEILEIAGTSAVELHEGPLCADTQGQTNARPSKPSPS